MRNPYFREYELRHRGECQEKVAKLAFQSFQPFLVFFFLFFMGSKEIRPFLGPDVPFTLFIHPLEMFSNGEPLFDSFSFPSLD